MSWLPADRFEEMILKIGKSLREEQERARFEDGTVVDNGLVKLPARGRAVFVGDLHGDLRSLEEVLSHTGFSSGHLQARSLDRIIFLGDYVDRGLDSVEVLTKLFVLKMELKEKVTLLKGNHELPGVNSRYGFIDEVNRKYPREGEEIYRLCNRLFDRLPHAVVTDNGIFAVHGGIPERVSTLLQIAKLKGDRLEQVLWNDPRPEVLGFEPNYGRDPLGQTNIRCFGNDVTEKFLGKIKARVLVRAHESLEGSGYLAFSKRVLSIFSTRYGRQNWRRAYIDTVLSREIEDVDSLVPDVRIF